MSEEILEEWGRQQLDDQTFEPPYDPYAGKPWGEQQGQIDHLERAYDDPNEYSEDDFNADWYEY